MVEQYAKVEFYTTRSLEHSSLNRVLSIISDSRDEIPSSFKPIPDSHYHLSVITSQTDITDSYKPDLRPLELIPVRWDIWGMNDSYLILECRSNRQLDQQISKALMAGAQMVHPSYRPHVSFLISSGKKRFDVSQIAIPKTPILFGSERIKAWNPT
jgi:hypothetical protein